MDFNVNIPIYIQIMELIKQKLILGELLPGGKMPSVRELSQELKVNPTTIQRVYKELESEQLTFTKRGMGSFVTEEKGRIEQLKRQIAEKLTNDYINKMTNIGIEKDALVELLVNYVKEGKENDKSR